MSLSNAVISEDQEKLFEDEDFLLTYLFLSENEATVTQIRRFTGLSQLRVAHILNKLMNHELVKKLDYIGERNIQTSMYTTAVQNIDMSKIAEKNKIGATHLIIKKVQRDISQILSNDIDGLIPKISYTSFQLADDSYNTVLKKLNEVQELIKDLEKQDLEHNKTTTPAVFFQSFYSNLISNPRGEIK
ncbi:hypothetical protein [Alkalihalobacillus sp. AL-G]|uniref:hypothetical protein n=1 Tax=Alkalihalobacillus sp. AL-G TaxID=2926399 RepID=UPI00272AB2EA|nr:hypothetical protein [Alkalihalobacillus sp. AL-G]WLD93108.1 hypothetical protein MOJ78_19265 [Alkalihalobacillus sp. AL-G]